MRSDGFAAAHARRWPQPRARFRRAPGHTWRRVRCCFCAHPLRASLHGSASPVGRPARRRTLCPWKSPRSYRLQRGSKRAASCSRLRRKPRTPSMRLPRNVAVCRWSSSRRVTRSIRRRARRAWGTCSRAGAARHLSVHGQRPGQLLPWLYQGHEQPEEWTGSSSLTTSSTSLPTAARRIGRTRHPAGHSDPRMDDGGHVRRQPARGVFVRSVPARGG